MDNRYFRFLLLINLSLCLTVILGCKHDIPIKIGYIGSLTGRMSGLGIQARDGVLLAVEQRNQAGGIKGHPIQLLIGDDRQNPKIALGNLRRMVADGAVAIISQMNSSVTLRIWPEIKRLRVPLLSPMDGADPLLGQDDFYFTIHGPNQPLVKRLAELAIQRDLKKAAIVYDATNDINAEAWIKYFRKYFEQSGRKVVCINRFVPGKTLNLNIIATELLQDEPDLILALTNSYDTAVLFQKIRYLNQQVVLLATDRAMVPGFLENGGLAVEGVIYPELYNQKACNQTYRQFIQDYWRRFNDAPSLAAKSGYESTQVLLTVLNQSWSLEPDELKKTLLQQRVFPGLQSSFVVDRFGDARRRVYLSTVKNKVFWRIDDVKN